MPELEHIKPVTVETNITFSLDELSKIEMALYEKYGTYDELRSFFLRTVLNAVDIRNDKIREWEMPRKGD